MPHLTWSVQSQADLARLHAFLAQHSVRSANNAVAEIRDHVGALGYFAASGKLTSQLGVRQWIVRFGKGAFKVRYRVTPDEIVILTIQHSRELPRP